MRNNKLPVFHYKDPFLKLLSDSQTIVIVGETGSGKTTQIPQWCLEYCNRVYKQQQLCVACTQPRRIAAMSVSARVAKEMNVTLGQEVGYSVRFETCSSPKTKLKYLTDGMLLREAMVDNLLSSYGIVIIDEAHERTLQTEILLGVIKRALLTRNVPNSNLPTLKVIIMSATIDVKLFIKYFDNCPLLTIEGRQYTVQDMFAEFHQSDLLTSTLITVFQIHRTTNEGDILVFCSGQDEISSLITLCKRVLKQAPEQWQFLTPLPLYASLPAKNQMRVFELNKTIRPTTNGINTNNKPTNGNSSHDSPSTSGNNVLSSTTISNSTTESSFTRRVIFATNVAETSVTIPNIKYVIDTGKVKCRAYCPKTGLESLKITNISKAQASQRSGRAGRIASGTCYRLYTSEEFAEMSEHQLPEIKRCNLDGILLQMISIGIKNISSFDFLERPDDARIKAALTNLLTLKAIKMTTKTKSNNLIMKDNEKDQKNSSPSTSASTTTSNSLKNSNNSSNNRIQRNSDVNGSDNLLNLNYELTKMGKKLSAFPLTPNMSRIILASNELGCLEEALTIVSLLYIENLFHIPPNKQNQADAMIEKFRSNEGDTIMLLKVFKAFKRTSLLNKANLKQWCNENFINVKNLKLASLVRKQLLELCKSQGMKPTSCGHETSIVRKALTYGLFNNVATMWNGKYRNKYSNEIYIHPSSCLFRSKPETILYVEVVETNKCYMRNCTLIDMNWVREISSTNITSGTSTTGSNLKNDISNTK